MFVERLDAGAFAVFEAIAFALDVDDGGAMQKPVEGG